MKQIIMSLLFVMVAMGLNAQNLFVGSYNIRYQNNSDAKNGNSWQQRCPRVCGIINFEQPDVFGAQEVLYPQLKDMLATLDGYDYIGVGRDDGVCEIENEINRIKICRLAYKMLSLHYKHTPHEVITQMVMAARGVLF